MGASTDRPPPNSPLAVAAQPVDRSRWIARLSWLCSGHEHLSERHLAILSVVTGRCCNAS
jgi:hypothetical protein